MTAYAKAIAAFISAILVVAVPFLPLDGNWERWIQGVIAVLGAVAVYQVRNTPVQAPQPPA